VADLLKKRTAILLVLSSLHWLVAEAQPSGSPGVPADFDTLRVHTQAEEIYKRAEYERAFFIYRNELAPIGDKYGQYMVGYMYLRGKGVAEDRVAASAWYRLAAERDMPEFVSARDRLMADLAPEDSARSDQLFVELRKQYSDLALLMHEIRKDYETLRLHSASGLSFNGAAPVTAIRSGRSPGTRSAEDYYEQIERRIKARLKYIESRTDIAVTTGDIQSADLREIQQQLDDHLEALN
jgi:hypothetical protein